MTVLGGGNSEYPDVLGAVFVVSELALRNIADVDLHFNDRILRQNCHDSRQIHNLVHM